MSSFPLKLRAVAYLLITAFSWQEIAHAEPQLLKQVFEPSRVSHISARTPLQDPAQLQIPFQNVTLKEIHRGTSGRFFIHIQDAHNNLSGQQHLAEALKFILERHDIPVVLVEGSSVDVSLTDARKSLPAREWDRAARRLLFDGLIAGEEFLNLTSDLPMKLMGIEDPALYDQNLDAFAQLAAQRKPGLAYIHRIRASLERVKNKLYPEELLKYERNSVNADRFAANFEKLLTLAEKAGIPASPEIQKLIELKAAEKSIDFAKANAELTTQTSDGPELQKYRAYLKQFSLLAPHVLLEELESLENAVYQKLLASEDAQKIRAIDQYLRLVANGYQVSLPSDSFAALKDNEPDFPTQSWQAFLNDKLAELGYYQDLVPYRAHLESLKNPLFRFYELAEKRDTAFLQSASRILQTQNQKTAFLITGGYHTQNLTRLMRKNGDSYVVLTPLVTYATDRDQYENLLLAPLRLAQKDKATKSALRGAGAREPAHASIGETQIPPFVARYEQAYGSRIPPELQNALKKIVRFDLPRGSRIPQLQTQGLPLSKLKNMRLLNEELGTNEQNGYIFAADSQSFEPVIVKILDTKNPTYRKYAAVRTMIRREVEVLNDAAHHSPDVAARRMPKLLGYGTIPHGERSKGIFKNLKAGPEYLIEALVPGESILQKHRRLIASQTPRDELNAIVIQDLLAAAKGLKELHDAGIIHRDLGPQEIFIEPNGEARFVDFAVSSTPFVTVPKGLQDFYKEMENPLDEPHITWLSNGQARDLALFVHLASDYSKIITESSQEPRSANLYPIQLYFYLLKNGPLKRAYVSYENAVSLENIIKKLENLSISSQGSRVTVVDGKGVGSYLSTFLRQTSPRDMNRYQRILKENLSNTTSVIRLGLQEGGKIYASRRDIEKEETGQFPVFGRTIYLDLEHPMNIGGDAYVTAAFNGVRIRSGEQNPKPFTIFGGGYKLDINDNGKLIGKTPQTEPERGQRMSNARRRYAQTKEIRSLKQPLSFQVDLPVAVLEKPGSFDDEKLGVYVSLLKEHDLRLHMTSDGQLMAYDYASGTKCIVSMGAILPKIGRAAADLRRIGKRHGYFYFGNIGINNPVFKDMPGKYPLLVDGDIVVRDLETMHDLNSNFPVEDHAIDFLRPLLELHRLKKSKDPMQQTARRAIALYLRGYFGNFKDKDIRAMTDEALEAVTVATTLIGTPGKKYQNRVPGASVSLGDDGPFRALMGAVRQARDADMQALGSRASSEAWVPEKIQKQDASRMALRFSSDGKTLHQTPLPPDVDPPSYGPAVISPKGRIIVGDRNGKAYLDASIGSSLVSLAPHQRPVLSVAFSPNEKRAASLAADGTFHLYDAVSGQLIQRADLSRNYCSFAFSPDSRLVVLGTTMGELIFLDADSGQEIDSGSSGIPVPLQSLAVSPDGKKIASASSSSIIVWKRSDKLAGSRTVVPTYGEVLQQLNIPNPPLLGIQPHDWTWPMRFPDIYRSLFRIKRGYRNKPLRVAVMGPGSTLLESDESKIYSPQMIEIMAVLGASNVTYTVIDHMEDVLQTALHPEVYEFLISRILKDTAMEKSSFAAKMRKSLADLMLGAKPEDLEKSSGPFQLDPQKVKDFKIEGFQGRFERMNFGENRVDVIVSSRSFDQYSMQDMPDAERRLALLGRALRALTPGGTFVSDRRLILNIEDERNDQGNLMESPADYQKALRRLPQYEKALNAITGSPIRIRLRGRSLEITKMSAGSRIARLLPPLGNFPRIVQTAVDVENAAEALQKDTARLAGIAQARIAEPVALAVPNHPESAVLIRLANSQFVVQGNGAEVSFAADAYMAGLRPVEDAQSLARVFTDAPVWSDAITLRGLLAENGKWDSTKVIGHTVNLEKLMSKVGAKDRGAVIGVLGRIFESLRKYDAALIEIEGERFGLESDVIPAGVKRMSLEDTAGLEEKLRALSEAGAGALFYDLSEGNIIDIGAALVFNGITGRLDLEKGLDLDELDQVTRFLRNLTGRHVKITFNDLKLLHNASPSAIGRYRELAVRAVKAILADYLQRYETTLNNTNWMA